MERISEILSRVLADLGAQFPQEEKGGIPAAVIAPIGRDGGAGKIAGDADTRILKSDVCTFTTDDTLPAQRGRVPKTSAGDKWTEPGVALELSGGVQEEPSRPPMKAIAMAVRPKQAAPRG